MRRTVSRRLFGAVSSCSCSRIFGSQGRISTHLFNKLPLVARRRRPAQGNRGIHAFLAASDPARGAPDLLAAVQVRNWRALSSACALRPLVRFLTRKWSRELDYRLIKELWASLENRIAVRFAYEWHNDSGN